MNTKQYLVMNTSREVVRVVGVPSQFVLYHAMAVKEVGGDEIKSQWQELQWPTDELAVPLGKPECDASGVVVRYTTGPH